MNKNIENGNGNTERKCLYEKSRYLYHCHSCICGIGGLDEATGEKDYVMAWQQKQKFKFQCLENYDLVCKLGENMVTEKEKKACRFIAEWL